MNTLTIAHEFLRRRIQPGAFCIDATAGRGKDTALLCRLAGPAGQVLAMDIQKEAVTSTRALLEKEGLTAEVVLDSHANIGQYAAPGTVDAVVFNFGYLPGGDHRIFTRAESSIPALEASLTLLKEGGVISACIYYGGANGYQEKEALMAYFRTVDPGRFTVFSSEFLNRSGEPPIAVFVVKES